MRFKKWKPPKMKHGKFTKWKWLPYYPENIKIGKNVDIGAFCFLQGEWGIEIGENTQIGSHCSIYSNNTINETFGSIKIGKNCCIGSHTIILPGVIIPDNCFIKAHSTIQFKDNHSLEYDSKYRKREKIY